VTGNAVQSAESREGKRQPPKGRGVQTLAKKSGGNPTSRGDINSFLEKSLRRTNISEIAKVAAKETKKKGKRERGGKHLSAATTTGKPDWFLWGPPLKNPEAATAIGELYGDLEGGKEKILLLFLKSEKGMNAARHSLLRLKKGNKGVIGIGIEGNEDNLEEPWLANSGKIESWYCEPRRGAFQ